MTRTRIGLALGGLALIGGLACSQGDENPLTTSPPADTDGLGTPAAQQTAKATPTGPASVIDDGTWTVGVDVLAGTYRALGAGNLCYWSITRSGTNGQDIVQNAIGGGNLTVTIKAGQDFETKRCGTWNKTG